MRLKVGELTSRQEFGKGIGRIDSKTMKDLGIREGDIIELEGKKKSSAIAVKPYPADVGFNIIRIDGLIRNNAGTSLGEYVKVRKAAVKEAKKIVLAPAQKGLILHISPNLLKRNLYMRPVTQGDVIVPSPVVGRRGSGFFEDFFGEGMFEMEGMTPFGSETRLLVVKTIPEGAVRVDESTEIELKHKAVDVEKIHVPMVTYEDVGGLREEMRKVREMIELPMKHPELFERLGIEPPKGVLLHGPPGTGKTLLAKAVANEAGAHFISINGPEIMSKWYGESEKRLRELFKDAETNAPSIIFIDEIDAIAPKREEVTGEVERRVVSQLLTLMDGLESRGQIVIIAATNRVNAIDPALRRPGRFDREIEIGVPNKKGRKEVLQIHARRMPIEEGVNIDHIASITYGFVGADLAALVREAAMHALRRVLPEISGIERDEPVPSDVLEKLRVRKEDFEYAMRMVEPSAMREVMIEIPKIKWTDIGGLDEVKSRLKEVVEWPLKHPKAFKRLGISPPRGILLYGPPGCGKTLLAKAVASESEANFISIKGPELLSKWVGESEKMIRNIFKKAKQVAPTIVFFDEIDSVAPRRSGSRGENVTERVVSQLLTELNGLEDLHDVVVIAATNRPDIVDPALLRPGRFDRQIFINPPDREARLAVFRVHTAKMPLKDVNIDMLADKTDGYSGADIEAICTEAGLNALREDMETKEVTAKNFSDALEKLKPSLTEEILEYYKNIDMKKVATAPPIQYIG